jgi:phospholipase/lecithinase/hemolysin
MNVTGSALQCNAQGDDCATASDPSSFMWYDALHPSEATSRLVAEHFVGVIEGKSKYGSYF